MPAVMPQIRILRVDGDVLSTPVYHYRHPGSGREVDLVLTVHFGEPDYYTHLRKVIDARTGAGGFVYCEGAARLDDHQGATAQERKLVAAMRRNAEVQRGRLHLIGWQSQLDGLAPDPDWQPSDLPALDIIRGVGVRKLRLQQFLTRLISGTDIDAAGADKVKLELALAARGALRPVMQKSLVDNVLLDRRNAAALSAVQGDQRNAVLLWGARHGPGMDAGLRILGYHRTGADWYRVAEAEVIGQRNPPTTP